MTDDNAAMESGLKLRCATPYPGCFVGRVCICLIAKEMAFSPATKSLQQSDTTRLASGKGTDKRHRKDAESAEAAQRYPIPRCVCVNAVDKGVSG
jgi:hypothetical protein